MRKFSSEFEKLLSDLGFSAPGESIPMEIKEEQTEYIRSFHDEGKYQWPVQVALKEKNVKPKDMKIKHFKKDQWGPITKENTPYLIGHFYPDKYLNPSHPTGHSGVDLSAPIGTPIYPIAPGIVWKTTPQETKIGGITAHIKHEDGKVVSYYAHMNDVNVSPGQEVNFNTIIGTVGKTGNARFTSPHLHYSIKVNDKLVDPQSVIGKSVGSLSKQAIAQDMWDLLEKFSIENVRKDKINDMADSIKPSLPYKKIALTKIIDAYLNNSPISGKDIISILKDKDASDLGDAVRKFKIILSENPYMLKKEAKDIIESLA